MLLPDFPAVRGEKKKKTAFHATLQKCVTAYKQPHRYRQTGMVHHVISALIVGSPFSILFTN